MAPAEHFGLALVTAPAAEPLDRDALVKPWLRVDADDTGQDAVLDGLIAPARRRCEAVARRALVTQTWRLSLDRFPGWWLLAGATDVRAVDALQWDPLGMGVAGDPRALALPLPPLSSVTSVQYVATDGTLTTLAASAYEADADSQPGRLLPAYGTSWPLTRWQPRGVRVTYVAGYGAASAVPEDLKQALLAHVAYCWRVREDQDQQFLDSLFVPFAVGGMG